MLAWIFYATSLLLVRMLWRSVPLPMAPVAALDPFRIANRYGLFAVMTPARYEIEFQGSDDGQTWTAYPFRYKPQALDEAPRKRGEASCERDVASCRRGEASCKRGEASCKCGEASCKRGEASGVRGEAQCLRDEAGRIH